MTTSVTVIETPLGWHTPDLSAFRFALVTTGRIIVKKNHLERRHPHGIGPDSVYRAWAKAAAAELWSQWVCVFREPIPRHVALNVAVISYLKNRHGEPDLSGTYEGPQDVLQAHTKRCKSTCKVHAGVIVNDSQVRGHCGSDIRIDPVRPRVELIITPKRSCTCATA